MNQEEKKNERKASGSQVLLFFSSFQTNVVATGNDCDFILNASLSHQLT